MLTITQKCERTVTLAARDIYRYVNDQQQSGRQVVDGRNRYRTFWFHEKSVDYFGTVLRMITRECVYAGVVCYSDIMN